MTLHFDPAACFADKKRKNTVVITPVTEKGFAGWLKKTSAQVQKIVKDRGFKGQPGKIFILHDKDGEVASIAIGLNSPVSIYELAPLIQMLRQNYTAEFIKDAGFALDTSNVKKDEANALFLSWALACYEFSPYKKSSGKAPVLLWDKKADKKRVLALAESICLIRDLVTTPSNDMGPEELEKSARDLAKTHTAKVSVIKDEELLAKNFPLIYAVGDASPRRPRLIDLTWGSVKNPKVTIVGKGVAFDTGGLNLKPTVHMALMKKDMGGAAHALALGHLIMALDLPVRLRVLIPAVENSVSGSAFRPGDIFKSRKGITIENTNTDAEGRLILSDTLTYACEDKPDLLVDYATLTGSARAALGPDIPAAFSNDDKLAEQLKKLSFENEDPVWPMPLWPAYHKHNDSAVADMQNSSGVPGDLMYSALFLQKFLTGDPDWIHLDCYAWEHSGKPGRPRGGADTGLRAVFALIEKRYSKK